MNCSKKTTEMKVKIIVRLLPGADNKTITDLLRDAHPDLVIGNDYVQSVRRAWKKAGMTTDYTMVLDNMRYSHHCKKEKDIDGTLFPDNNAQDAQEKAGDFSEHEIAMLKKLVWFIDAIKSTE